MIFCLIELSAGSFNSDPNSKSSCCSPKWAVKNDLGNGFTKGASLGTNISTGMAAHFEQRFVGLRFTMASFPLRLRCGSDLEVDNARPRVLRALILRSERMGVTLEEVEIGGNICSSH